VKPTPPMGIVILEIIRHTPPWVWAILAAIVVLGALQMRDQRPARLRVLLLPLGLGAYSAWGALSLFGAAPGVIAAWLAGALGLALASRTLPWARGVRHDPAGDRIHVPGTVWPLLLMLAVFAVRYAVVVTLVCHHEWAADAAFAAAVAGLYGALSGVFAGRALALLGTPTPAAQRVVVHQENAHGHVSRGVVR